MFRRYDRNRRITPAPAGNTDIVTIILPSYKDHPCTRREHVNYGFIEHMFLGSPLHPQGTLNHKFRQKKTSRITPAPAGNTPVLFPADPLTQDHPCTRREHVSHLGIFNVDLGSPLHPQGTLPFFRSVLKAFRITPAPAGNTSPPANQMQMA